MVPPAFGFSAGDFVAAIGLTIKIGKAIRETGGATTEYRLVSQDLQLLRQVLETTQALQPYGANAGHVNAIRGMLSIERGSAKNALSRSGKKAQWAISAAEEVSKFRAIIAAKVVTISMLLGVCNRLNEALSEALSRIETRTQEVQNTLQLKAAETSQHLDDKFSPLSVLGEERHNYLLTSVTQARESLKDDVSDLSKRAESHHRDFIGSASEQQEALARLDRRLQDARNDATSNLKGLVEICCGIKTANERVLKATTSRFQHVDSQLVSIKSEQQGTRTEISFGFGSISSQLKMIHAIGKSLLNNLIPFSQTVLDCLRRKTSTNMEIYALLLKIQNNMPNRVLLPAQDVVHFEDVLGRTKDLPYAYFHHWDVFESML